ncbi:EI24 domain-containing protein [Candidatus Sumerlaeota bacterium]|nr:EI24 domain-containing protein [Candidatus Sumerlaeota bacterium]
MAQQRSRIRLFFFSLASIPYLLARPRLLALALAPLLINLVVFVSVCTLLTNFFVIPWFQGHDQMTTSTERILDVVMAFLVGTFLIASILVCAAAISFLLIIPLGAPFCSIIAERIEAEMLATRPQLLASLGFWPSVRHSLFEALRRILFVLPLYVILFAIAWVPVIGTITAAVLGFLANAMFLSLDGFSYSLDCRMVPFQQKREFLKENRGTWLPFGVGLATLALIPCNIFWLPILSCVGATRLYCEKRLSEAPEIRAD